MFWLINRNVRKELFKQNIKMWHIPPRSPDLNAIERFWGWLKKDLWRRDLNDLVEKRAPLGKLAFKMRVQVVLRSDRAQQVAKSQAKALRKVCKVVIKKRGAASGY